MPDTHTAFPSAKMKSGPRPHPALDFARFNVDSSNAANRIAKFLRLVVQRPSAALSVATTLLAGKRLRAHNLIDAMLGRGLCTNPQRWLGARTPRALHNAPLSEYPPMILLDASYLAGLPIEDIRRRINSSLAALPREIPKTVALPLGLSPPADLVGVHARFVAEGLGEALSLLAADHGQTRKQQCLYLRAGDAPLAGMVGLLQSRLSEGRLGVFGDDVITRKNRDPIIVLRSPWDDLQQMTIGHGETAFLFSAHALESLARAAKETGEQPQLRELLFYLSLHAGENALHHVPFALVRRDGSLLDYPVKEEIVEEVMERRVHATWFLLEGRGERAIVEAEPASGLVRVQRMPANDIFPRTTIIIPTRDRLDLLKPCVESILATIRGLPCEILIVDNGSEDSATLSWMCAMKDAGLVDVIRDDGPFDFSRLNNRAVRHAQGDMVIFLNNDTEVLSENWVIVLAAHAMREDTGAVGALLLYPDGKVQHAGVCTSTREGPSHAHHFFPSKHPGYLFRLRAPQRYSAVTAACMAVEKWKFLAVGGFREKDLAVALNDVDLCLRLEERGWRTAWEPAAILYHKESATRRKDRALDQVDRWRREMAFFRDQWKGRVEHDPWYHPGHGQRVADFSIGCEEETGPAA